MQTSIQAVIAYSIIMAALVLALVLLAWCGGIIAVRWNCRCASIAHVTAATDTHIVILCQPAVLPDVMILLQIVTSPVVLGANERKNVVQRSVLAQSFMTGKVDFALASWLSLTPESPGHI